ncbi:universal stress protein [Mycolicibacterium elephantis]|uniref:universal stress protein n=1 Tax=Mycolicibacterium elephantis TaxID=81858 RepID=UPI000FE1B846|nr:universal stress protein [Mycolicibacterium elephantis]MCV7222692.1 universal stress protein [Mycolicibacterium elephantis]
MSRNSSPAVVAGIDGSQEAIHAALWAADEALHRNVPLRLVCVTKPKYPSTEEYYEDVRRARASLRLAQNAIEATGKQVKIETDVVAGLPGTALVAASWDAVMVCVGSVGIGRYARSILGSTAAYVAENAQCTVAIIRPPDEGQPEDINWILVAVTDAPDNDAVVEHAMSEAQLRHAPVLALGDSRDREKLQRKVEMWKQRFPDVHVYPVAGEADVADFLRKHRERVQLAVIGAAEAGEAERIVGSYYRGIVHHAGSSVIIVRSRASGTD